MIARIFLSWIVTVPPSPMIASMTPCRLRKKARVTTNDGMPSRDTSSPIERPDDDAGEERGRRSRPTTASRGS